MNKTVQNILQTQKVSVKNMREYLKDLLGMVHYGHKEVMIEKNGEEFAVLVNPTIWREYKRQLNDKFYQTVQELWEANTEFSVEEIEQDIEEARNEVYRMRHGRQK